MCLRQNKEMRMFLTVGPCPKRTRLEMDGVHGSSGTFSALTVVFLPVCLLAPPRALCQDKYCSAHEFCALASSTDEACFCRAIFASSYTSNDTLGTTGWTQRDGSVQPPDRYILLCYSDESATRFTHSCLFGNVHFCHRRQQMRTFVSCVCCGMFR